MAQAGFLADRPDIAALVAETVPAWLFTAEGGAPVWSNTAGASFLGLGDVAHHALLDWSGIASQIGTIARSRDEGPKLWSLRLPGPARQAPAIVTVRRVAMDDRTMVLITGPAARATAPEPAPPVEASAPVVATPPPWVGSIDAPAPDPTPSPAMAANDEPTPRPVPEVVAPPVADAVARPTMPPPDEAPDPRAAALMSRARPLRFGWSVGASGRLDHVSPEAVGAFGAEAFPAPDETFAAFAERAALDPTGRLAVALGERARFQGIETAWPLGQSPRRALVELSGAPAGAGLSGLGVVRGLAPLVAAMPPDPEPEGADDAVVAASGEPVEVASREAPSDADAEIMPIAAKAPPVAGSAATALDGVAAPTMLDTAPVPPAEPLAPAESATFAEIGRVLGGPIAANAAGLDGADPDVVSAVASGAEIADGASLPEPAPRPETIAAETVAPEASTPEVIAGEVIATDVPAADVPAAEVLTEDVPAPAVPARSDPVDAPTNILPFALARVPAEDQGEALANARRDLAEAQARHRELEAILDTATDGVVILSANGRILSMNTAAEVLFGHERGALVGEPLSRLIAPTSRAEVDDYLAALQDNGVASVLNDGRDVAGLERHGRALPLFLTIGRIGQDGDSPKFCAVMKDVSTWKTAERNLVEAKSAAERASGAKSDFLAKISHEIRTPLNAIIGFSEVMMEERFGPVGNERYQGYVRDIHASGQHIMSLVNDLLDLAKIEAGKLELSLGAVHLGDLVQQAVAILGPQANREGVILRTSLASLPAVVADARSVRQILLNLLSNAVRFTKPGGQVFVSTNQLPTGEIALKVRDTGVGMSEREIAIAMEPFRQVANAPRSGAGTGLGLPITKALAEANRAGFTIESEPGAGTLVQIVFPATRVLAE